MRRLLLALPFALLPLAAAHADHHEDHEAHGSLGAHEHGVATLNVALDAQALEIALESPAMNLLGFEHAASSAEDQARVAAARAQLEQPLALFGLPAAAGCSVSAKDLRSPLFGGPAEKHEHGDDDHAAAHESEHSDIDAGYKLSCSHPEALEGLDLGVFFKAFPATQKLKVQLIGPNGQQGAELTPSNSRLQL
ncbi:DUF2796 domain-containing protein [Pseudomonas cavernae]|uniref:DUF2796 domain-containing protein n=1 Tax=Pseudomonas cavernae TaxID=2320867 RepID=A0A385YZL6_9PSED|nr:DUF2796 domain-containing protein [Pseudomonas cavernae]AYC31417.1 DUF2796 domain-containing protein [Pseudomonas cavernae]